jgi:hypothetical protein
MHTFSKIPDSWKGAFVPPTLSEIASITGIKNADAHDALADARHVYQIWKWLEGLVEHQ